MEGTVIKVRAKCYVIDGEEKAWFMSKEWVQELMKLENRDKIFIIEYEMTYNDMLKVFSEWIDSMVEKTKKKNKLPINEMVAYTNVQSKLGAKLGDITGTLPAWEDEEEWKKW